MKKIFFAFLLLSIFCCSLFSQHSLNPVHAKDWFKLDPLTDSIAGIGLYKANSLLQNRKSVPVIVAVIDNGVDIEHDALKDHIWTNSKEIPGNGIDDDHNGYIDDMHGWNFRGAKDGTIIENEQAGATQVFVAWKNKKVNEIYRKAKTIYLDKLNNSKDSNDIKYAYNVSYHSSRLIANDNGQPGNHLYGSPLVKLSVNLSHGTHVAGIIASVDTNVLIMPVVASTAVGDERDKDVANAIHYAADNGAQIINISFSKTFSANKEVVEEAIHYAERKNVLIVHCAGNDGVNNDSTVNYHYPIGIYNNGKRANNFITVGWNRPLFDYRLAHPYGDYGKVNVDLYAPGSDIWSTVPGNGYDFKSGSSMSAPVASGAAALLLSYFPSLTAVQIKEILIASVFKPDQMVNKPQTKTPVPFNSLSVSGGILNVYNAVKTIR
ncbi:MAG: S8 family serine peptidase [Bacteroidota bacterium]